MSALYGLLMFLVFWALLSATDASLPSSHLSLAIPVGIAAGFGYWQGQDAS